MMKRQFLIETPAKSHLLLYLLLLLGLLFGGRWLTRVQAQPNSVSNQPHIESEPLPSGSMMFIENVGQFADEARFQVWGGTNTMWLAQDGLWITLIEASASPLEGQAGRDAPAMHLPDAAGQPNQNPAATNEPRQGVNLKLSFVGANPRPRLQPFQRLETKVSYFLGHDAEQWRADVPVWGGVRYVDLYPGIDLEITSEAGQFMQRLVAHPDADLQAVRLRVEGADGIELTAEGLRLSSAIRELTLPLLQAVTPDHTPFNLNLANLHPTINNTTISAPFSPSLPPTRSLTQQDNPELLLYSTFLGGGDRDRGRGIDVDEAGNAYITSSSRSSDFPTTPGAFDTSRDSCCDAVVVKVNSSGNGLVYATFLGGGSSDFAHDIAVDSASSAYVIGLTYSSNFPTTQGAFDTNYNGGTCRIDNNEYSCPDAFVVKLNATGTGLVYATFIGGSDYDSGIGIAIDGSGNAYVTGHTKSDNFPTTAAAFDTSYNGGAEWPIFGYSYGDAFVAKLNSAGSGLYYSTYLGGSSFEARFAKMALLPTGEVIVTGVTGSSDFPITASFDTTHNGGADVYVTRLSADGRQLIYSTFLGGSNDEQGDQVIIDGTGAAYVAGWTYSSNFPSTADAVDPTYNGSADGFVVKLDATGNHLTYATFLGGSGLDDTYTMAIDPKSRVYVSGDTNSTDFPTTPDAFDTSFGGGMCSTDSTTRPCDDAYLVKLSADGEKFVYATFLGGSNQDGGHHIAIDSAGNAYVTGSTYSADFPTTAGAFDTSHNGNQDAFVAKLAVPNPLPTISGISPSEVTTGGGDFMLTVSGSNFVEESVVRWNGSNRATTFVSGSQLVAQIAAADVAATGRASVTVFTPPLGGGTSNGWTLNINNPSPSITSLSPGSTTVGGGSFVLTVNGRGFVRESVVRWNGSERATTFVSRSQLVAQITAADVATAGYANVTVFSPSPGGGTSNAGRFSINHPAPSLATISPTWLAAGGEAFALTVNGTNFVRESVVRWNGLERATTFVSSSQLTAQITAQDIATIASASVTVFTPSPGGGVSDEQLFTIADAYESDDNCAQATTIATDGTLQAHTFHQQADDDWVRFEVTEGMTYTIEARVPPSSPVDLIMERYSDCGRLPETFGPAYSPDIRQEYTSSTDGYLYLHFLNENALSYGAEVQYDVSVRALDGSDQHGALIIVAGKYEANDPLQRNIHQVTDQVYRLFRQQGHPEAQIHYLATDISLDPDGDGVADVDGLANGSNLQNAITEWAAQYVGPERALTLFLMDHGGYDKLYLDGTRNELLKPAELDSWLTQLETQTGTKVNIIIEACQSGSFISLDETISKSGRVIMTATDTYAPSFASQNGAVFSDALLSALAQGFNLKAAFDEAKWAVQEHPQASAQIPWLESDGNGLPNQPSDNPDAERRGFAITGSFPIDRWSPYIREAEIKDFNGIQAKIWAKVLDDQNIQNVWAVLYPPSYQAPESSEEIVPSPDRIPLLKDGSVPYGAEYSISWQFTELGEYHLVIYAEDDDGLISRPKEISLRTGWGLYLPLIMR